MSLNESKRKPRRERWPLEFDLAGIPRDTKIRQALLDERLSKEQQDLHKVLEGITVNQNQPVNSFLSDKLTMDKAILLDQILESYQNGGVGRDIDLSKPPVVPYKFNPFPAMVYNHETGAVLQVIDERQLKAAVKRGYQTKPSKDRDYSKVRNGVAPMAEQGPERIEQFTAEELAAMDEAEGITSR
jgi:hypothetical protein